MKQLLATLALAASPAFAEDGGYVVDGYGWRSAKATGDREVIDEATRVCAQDGRRPMFLDKRDENGHIRFKCVPEPTR